MKTLCTSLLLIVCLSLTVAAQDIELPLPRKTSGKPLMTAISERQTDRNIVAKEIDLQTLSDLLWGAYGFNRPDKRVVATAHDKQEIALYVVLEKGAYLYDAKNNKLLLKVKGDHRKVAGKQDFVYIAPVNLLFVADFAKETTREQSCFACGAIAQNVYLVSASNDLACAVRTTFDKDEISKLLQLGDKQEVLIAQTIGHKK